MVATVSGRAGATTVSQRILVVDDDPLTREVLETILDLEAFVAVFASDGLEALERFQENGPFDAVVTDVMMPGLDGVELCRRIRASGDAERASTPVILLTAKDRRSDREEGFEAGCDAYLTKPFSPLNLIDTIESLNQERRHR